MNSVSDNIISQIRKAAEGVFPGNDFSGADFSLVRPPRPEMGDFAFPCFKLAASLKDSPAKLAKELAEKIAACPPIEKIESQGPYLNFFLDQRAVAGEILGRIGADYGKRKKTGRSVVIDFSQPNIGKPMHVGHIRSTVIGDSLAKTYGFLGWKVTGINYLGDVGLHIGKLIAAWELWLDRENLKKNATKELLRLYVKFCDKEQSEFSEGQEGEDYGNNEWTQKARGKTELLEKGDAKTHLIWREIFKYSWRDFEKIYEILGVRFGEVIGQSEFSEEGKKAVAKALGKSLARREKDGAVCVEFADMPKKYVLRSNQTASYMTQDIGAAIVRNRKYKFDKMVYVVDFRQTLHFRQLFAILEKFGYGFYEKCFHLPFGTVSFGREVMATRKGKVLLLEDVLKKTVEKAEREIRKRKTQGDARKVGVGAIKYLILRSEPAKDVEFSWESAFNFEGETGPYLQYSYARASSILRKSKKKPRLSMPAKLEAAEAELARKMGDFPEVVEEAASGLNPALICHYACQLAQAFNDFYHSCPVIGSPQEAFRLKLVDCFRKTLKNALYLLGIEVMERM